MDLSIEDLERIVSEKKRRLQLIQESSELDKQLSTVQGPQNADRIVDIDSTQPKKKSQQQNLFSAFKMTASVTTKKGLSKMYYPAIIKDKSFYTCTTCEKEFENKARLALDIL